MKKKSTNRQHSVAEERSFVHIPTRQRMYKNFLNLKVMSVSLGVVHFKVYTC